MIGDLALSVQGADDPVRTVKQVLRFVQRLVEETPEMTGAGVTLEEAEVTAMLADLEAGGGVPEGHFTVTPGLILTAGMPAGASAGESAAAAPAADDGDAIAMPAPGGTDAPASAGPALFDDPDSDAPLAASLAEDDPAHAEPETAAYDAPPADEAGTRDEDRLADGPDAAADGAGTRHDPSAPLGLAGMSTATLAAMAGLGGAAAGRDGDAPAAAEADTPAHEATGPEDTGDDAMEPAFARLRTAMSMDRAQTEDTAASGAAGQAEASVADAPAPEPVGNIFAPPRDAAPEPGEMRPSINIFARGADEDGPARAGAADAPMRERTSIAAGPETGGARVLADAPEEDDAAAPDPAGALRARILDPPADAPETEAPAGSSFDALVARYRKPGGEAAPAEAAPETDEAASGAPDARDAPSGDGAPDAATLARLSGAEGVSDLLAASAAALSLGGQTRFSRREVMEVFDAIPGDHPRSLEARIKGYGKLVRSGALVLVEDGLFSLSEAEEDRFRALLR